MKMKTIEEKAKAYDEAIKKAKGVIEQNPLMEYLKKGIEYILPELKESEDERMLREIKRYIKEQGNKPTGLPNGTVAVADMLAWLEKQGEQKPAWSEEDECRMNNLCHFLEEYGNQYYGHLTLQYTISWLKSLRPQKQWKPSEEMLEALYRVIHENVMEKSEDEILLDKLYQGLKYGRVLSKN